MTKTGLAMGGGRKKRWTVEGMMPGRFLAAVFLMMGLSGLFGAGISFCVLRMGNPWNLRHFHLSGNFSAGRIQQRPAGSRTDPLSFICRDLLWTDSGWISDTVQ